eukprot:gene112-26_t
MGSEVVGPVSVQVAGANPPLVGLMAPVPALEGGAVISSPSKAYFDASLYQSLHDNGRVDSSFAEYFGPAGDNFEITVCKVTYDIINRINHSHADRFQVGALGVIDSGATHHISSRKDLFESIDHRIKVKLNVASGAVVVPAHPAKFMKNNLGIEYGLWHPEVKSTLISVPELCKAGGEAHFVEGAYVLRTVGGVDMQIDMRDSVPSVWLQILRASESVVDQSMTECGIESDISDCYSIRCEEPIGPNRESGSCQLIIDVGVKKSAFLDIVAADFTGPYPPTLELNTWLLSFLDQFTRWAEVFACAHRSSAGELLGKFISNVGRPKIVRSDNATEFKAPNSGWRAMCAKQNPTIECSYSAPYVPQMNGNVERFQGTLLNAVRSNLQGTDPRLWEWCARFVCYIYNRLDKQKTKSPFFHRYGRDPNLSKLRRFGSLCYARVNQETRLSKLHDRWERGIFLGFSRNSCFLVGIYRPDSRRAEGYRFNVFENRYVKVDESILVQKVEHLMHFQKGTFTPYSLPASLPETDVLGDLVTSGVGCGVPGEGSCKPSLPTGRSPPSLAGSKTVGEKESQSVGGVPIVSGNDVETRNSTTKPSMPASKNPSQTPENIDSVVNSKENDNDPDDNRLSGTLSGPQAGQNDEPDPRVYWENGIRKKRKGRLPGSKRQEHWLKPGPKPKDPNLRGGKAKIKNILSDLASLGRYGVAGAESVLYEDTVQLLQLKAKEFCKEIPVGEIMMVITRAIRAGKRILAYLKGTKGVGIEYSRQNEANFRSVYEQIAKEGGHKLDDTVAFSDSDFAGCSTTFKSTSGSILYYRGTPICWSAKLQSVKSLSTCEAEYVAIFDTVKLSRGLGFLDWVLSEDQEVPLVMVDNQSAIALSKNSLITKKSKHISMRYHVVKDYCRSLCYCQSDKNRADPLTKILPCGKYIPMFLSSGDDMMGMADSDC